MNNANQIELNNNLEYWYGFIDANLVHYNRINISNVSLDNTTMEMLELSSSLEQMQLKTELVEYA